MLTRFLSEVKESLSMEEKLEVRNWRLLGASNNCFCGENEDFFRLTRNDKPGILVNIHGFS